MRVISAWCILCYDGGGVLFCFSVLPLSLPVVLPFVIMVTIVSSVGISAVVVHHIVDGGVVRCVVHGISFAGCGMHVLMLLTMLLLLVFVLLIMSPLSLVFVHMSVLTVVLMLLLLLLYVIW